MNVEFNDLALIQFMYYEVKAKKKTRNVAYTNICFETPRTHTHTCLHNIVSVWKQQETEIPTIFRFFISNEKIEKCPKLLINM